MLHHHRSISASAVLSLTFLFIQRSNVMQLLVDMDERFWKIEECRNKELKAECLQKMKILKIKYRSYVSVLLSCILSYYYGRLIENRTADGDNLLFESYLPKGVPFWFMFLWMHIPGYGLSLLDITIDCTVFSIVSLTAIQFKLLAYEMQNIFAEASDYFTIKDKFTRCNDQLSFLLCFKTLLNNTLSTMMLMYLGMVVLILCLEMYYIMTMNSFQGIVRALIYAALIFFEFFICYCVPFQELVDESGKLVECLYDSRWYEHVGSTAPYAKAMLLLQGKSQMNVMLTAGGFLKMNLQTGLATLKTMVSYSMFLKTMAGLEDDMK
ncbi:unnamed protein product [Acanthoscelides obtectus]|uniref:Odorant receptor n=1 Tax=Acanthoscelides obtectus TaxID=200917 RepID=A0A9P0LS00_ACAOB|nr:unnamed protein product [Acanthoscelides obtectus]CAK1625942.1 hypothetical protein AOBTE_LOCUS3489 [Acanthoscelides obtectus]